ncbi:MAG: peptidase [Gemmatimonadetes bacterium]|uniref:Peptidase n=1 Tax=Candidatus Kutchimonas denitrificans TaxID=3056748 RepID=A0AAE4Z8S0_9BACT|nr:peptidase [Gemmatimonadota bacterium]NIR74572.1 peptidase [Candidatus Kutchimonas denitrificans]NIS02762.1 peptidase [Gemmatimonadota bacterium]NIT68923.1 peptidase [Gemmatimonadota bacterium]NIU52228.1 peptidase [Gemmatimonadota bacterium]
MITRRALIALSIVASAIALGCDDSSGPEDRIVAGVNMTELFAPPSAAEINAILAEWSTRDVSAQNVQVIVDAPLTLNTVDTRLRVVTHDVGDVTHYGAVLVPDGAQPGSLPVLMYLHGGDHGENLDVLLPLLPVVLGDDLANFIFVAPSFRSERLVYDGIRYDSDGPPSPWDRDVDDALALLNVTLDIAPEADADRIALLGFSRGAGVALLMAERDPRIDIVVEFFGPTDLFDPFIQGIVEEALLGELRDLPGLTHLDSVYIEPLQRGELTIADVRPELVRRSSVLFAERLPQLQIHHGIDDMTVEVSQAESLIETMQELGRGEPGFEFYLYDGGVHDPLTLPESIERTRDFLGRLLVALAGV